MLTRRVEHAAAIGAGILITNAADRDRRDLLMGRLRCAATRRGFGRTIALENPATARII